MNIGKLLLFSVGGYLLYTWLEKNNSIPSLTGASAAAPPPPVQTAPPPPTSLPAASVPLTADQQTSLNSTKQTLLQQYSTDPKPIYIQAAGGDAVSAAFLDSVNKTFTADEWNYYAIQANKGSTTDLFPAGNRGYEMTAGQYLAARKSAGLNGYTMRRNAWPQNHREVTTESVV